MPQYDYEIESGNAFDISNTLPLVYKGTVEAPDPRSACFVAFMACRGQNYPFPGTSWKDGPEYLDAHGESIEDGHEAFLDDGEFKPAEHQRDGTGVSFLQGDYVYEIVVRDHDPERALQPQFVDVVVRLRVTPREVIAWSEVQKLAVKLVRAHLQELPTAVGSVEFELGDVSSN